MEEQLAALLIDLALMGDKEADQFVFGKYVELYLDKGNEPKRMGVRKTHDGAEVLFDESRYEHAFGTTSDRINQPYANDLFDRQRGERVAWVGPVIAGDIEGTQCWEVPPKDGRQDMRPGRLYLVCEEAYVVWLVPSKQHGWWFSSAYVAKYSDIRRYCGKGRRIWTRAKKTP